MVYDPTTILQVMTEYFGGVLVLILTFLCWHFDRHGRANATTKASYVALVSLILLILTPPLRGPKRGITGKTPMPTPLSRRRFQPVY